MIRCIYILIFSLLFFKARTQDVHFSQPEKNSFSFTGLPSILKQNSVYANVSYRSQWKSGLGKGFTTFSSDFQYSFFEGKLNTGIYFLNDISGDAKLKQVYIGLPVSTAVLLSKNSQLTAGVNIAMLQRSFSSANLTWASQFNGNAIDAGISSGEPFAAFRKNVLDISLGVMYRVKKENCLDLAIGAAHLNRPDLSFYEGDQNKLETKYTGLVHFGLMKEKKKFIDFYHFTQIQSSQSEQLTYIEISKNSGMKSLYLNENKPSRFGGTIGYRWSDALVLGVFCDWLSEYQVSFTFDIVLSQAQLVTGARGGPEIALTYHPLVKNTAAKKLF